jgi:SAM-dependent methyltransferase
MMHTCKTYLDGSYDAKTGGTWHLEDSPFKARQIMRMLRKHPEAELRSVCDIGCGAGGILAELHRQIDLATKLVGYEVSPQAHALSKHLQNSNCEFVLGEPFADRRYFDVALVIDVVEHVEDCFGFMRRCGAKATWKIYHIPLDASASLILRGTNCWESVGHLHLFTMETAIKAVEHSGQRVVDFFLTPVSLERPHRPLTRLTNLLRLILPERLGARLLGGYSMMILAR